MVSSALIHIVTKCSNIIGGDNTIFSIVMTYSTPPCINTVLVLLTLKRIMR